MDTYEIVMRYVNLAIAIYDMEEACENNPNIEDIVDDLIDDNYEKIRLTHEEVRIIKEMAKKRRR